MSTTNAQQIQNIQQLLVSSSFDEDTKSKVLSLLPLLGSDPSVANQIMEILNEAIARDEEELRVLDEGIDGLQQLTEDIEEYVQDAARNIDQQLETLAQDFGRIASEFDQDMQDLSA